MKAQKLYDDYMIKCGSLAAAVGVVGRRGESGDGGASKSAGRCFRVKGEESIYGRSS
jgi:hypothetical protein